MRQIIQQGDHYLIAFDYDRQILSDVKLIPGRQFDPASRMWFVPLKSKRYVMQLADSYNFSVQGETPALLKNLNRTIPPMRDLQNQILLKMSLYEYQRYGVQYILDHKRVIIGDEQGVGKTAQAIAALYASGEYPALIICPATIKENWVREIEMWTGKRSMVLNDNLKNTWPLFHESKLCDIFICNYESLKKYFVADMPIVKDKNGKKVATPLKLIKFKKTIELFKTIIIDESHRAKDTSTQWTKIIAGIAQGKPNIYLITGTPVKNCPSDLIAQLGIMGRLGEFGGYIEFQKVFCSAEDRWPELNIMLRQRCYFRREKKDVLKDLPPKVRQIAFCDISTRKEYQDAENDLRKYLKEYKQATDAEIRRSMRGEVMVRIGILKDISARGKLDTTCEWINSIVESGEKVIVFAHLKDVQASILERFPKAVTIFGSDNMKERQANIDAFQNNPNVKVIICSIQAAGVGITLHASSRVIMVEQPWTPADAEQCEDRAHRNGQKNSVHCIYVIGKDTIDEHIYDIINKKRSMSQQITGSTTKIQTNVLDELIDIL